MNRVAGIFAGIVSGLSGLIALVEKCKLLIHASPGCSSNLLKNCTIAFSSAFSNISFLHINANGDIDPCVFVHYSDSNIREKTLLEALRSPMMMAYHQRQPFNKNMLRPCPMLENPEKLREMVSCAGAHSTDLQSPESVEHLCSKCDHYAENWKPVADELWEKSSRKHKYKYK